MRKFTLFIASLFLAVGAMAQPQVGKYYKIKGTHSTNPWLTAVVESGGIDVASNEANAGIYLVTENGIQELFTGKYIGTGGNGSQISLVDDAQIATIEATDGGRYLIKTGDRYLYNNQADYTREAGNLTAAGADTPKWYFIEVTPLFTVNNEFNGRGTLCYGNWTNGQEYLALSNITLNGYTSKSVTVTDDANKYWYVTRTNAGLHIYNIGKGLFMQPYSTQKVSCSADIANGFTTEIRNNNDIYYRSIKSGGYYLSFSCGYDPSNNVGQVRWLNNSEENATLLTFSEVANAATKYAAEIATANAIINGFALNVTDAGWATLFLGYNAEIPVFAGEDAGAYIVEDEGIKNGYIILTQVTGVLPANTGIIVKANAGNYTFNYAPVATANVENSLLEGSVIAEYITEDAYVLTTNETGVCFGKANKNQLDGTAWLNNANKAYLPASVVPASVQGAASFSFRFGEGTTGISEVKTESGEVKAIYDLTGRKVETISAPGIYIVNGKKILVK